MSSFWFDVTFSRQSHVAEAVGSAVAVNIVPIIDIMSSADVLNDLQTRANRDHLGGTLHLIGQPLDVMGILDSDPVVVANLRLIGDRGAQFGQTLSDSFNSAPGICSITEEKAQFEFTRLCLFIQCKSG